MATHLPDSNSSRTPQRPTSRSFDSLDQNTIPPPRQLGRPAPRRNNIEQLVETTILAAIESRASEIYFEPQGEKDSLQVRFVVDGTAFVYTTWDAQLAAPIVSRLKVLGDSGSADIAEHRRPQDWSFSVKVPSGTFDIRAATYPTVFNLENVTLRILDRGRGIKSLSDLGFDSKQLASFRQIIARPNGIVLVTGPTGSGKTTTLYSAIAELNTPARKIVTIEDPVEYRIPSISQAQVKPEIEFTFASALRASLRHRPNIILVGEIRDEETALAAINAAETGHLVFSTLHTTDTVGAVTRLQHLGVERHFISESLTAVVAQRLVRKLCEECRVPSEMTGDERALLGFSETDHPGTIIYHPNGCPCCLNTGYKGQVAVFEILDAQVRKFRDSIDSGCSREECRDAAVECGAITKMIEDAREKVIRGVTSVEEVILRLGAAR